MTGQFTVFLTTSFSDSLKIFSDEIFQIFFRRFRSEKGDVFCRLKVNVVFGGIVIQRRNDLAETLESDADAVTTAGLLARVAITRRIFFNLKEISTFFLHRHFHGKLDHSNFQL